MDNHPIPQDVTGFQFKLVGSMTIKQFVYVASGILTAVIIYYLPITPFIKFPLLFFVVLLGLAIAFLPLEGRPMDLMAANFLKALFKPNQFFYKKSGGRLSFSDLNLRPVKIEIQEGNNVSPNQSNQHSPKYNSQKEEQLESLLSSIDNGPQLPVDTKEGQFLSSLFSNTPQDQNLQQRSLQYNQPAPVTSPTPIKNQSVMPATAIPQHTFPIEKKITATNPSTLPQAQPLNTTVQPAVIQPAPSNQTTYVKVPQSTQQTQVVKPTTSDFPNLITGTVKDPRGNVLGGILVEVKNKDGESVRAFKTNALGQFASATQLPNGMYMLTFEDPKGQNTFSPLQIDINGSIQPSFEIVSIDAREELRRSLFG